MTAAEQVWIDNSLARLEELHAQRDQIEASGQLDRLAEIDEEIANLTEVLESVADASGPINIAANAPAAAPAQAYAAAPQAAPAQPAYAPPAAPAPAADYDPFAPPAPNPAAPAPVQQNFGGAPMADYSSDDDDFGGKSKAPLIIGLLVLLVGGGVAAFFAMGGMPEPEAKPAAAPQEAKVITATDVPEDTHSLKTAKGQDADRTPTEDMNVSAEPKRSGKSGRRHNGGGGRKSGSRRGGDKSKKGRELDLGKSRDPLGGM